MAATRAWAAITAAFLRHHPGILRTQGLKTQEWPKSRHVYLVPSTEPGFKNGKEIPFDMLLEREKQLRTILRVRDLLVRRPGWYMEIQDLEGNCEFIGMREEKSLSEYLRKYPTVFEVVKKGAHSNGFRLTPEAERLYQEEINLKRENEDRSVKVLRKVLMLSIRRRLPLEPLGHLATDLGLPDDFQCALVFGYPQYFDVEIEEGVPWLVLTSWDSRLAVSVAEMKDLQQSRLESSGEGVPRENIYLAKDYKLSKRHKKMLCRFRRTPFMSPYQDPRDLDSLEIRFERHAVAGIEELLNLTLEKRIIVDHLLNFSEEFTFSYKIKALVSRHPHLFYVSSIGNMDTIFLREAYQGRKLLQKHALVVAKERFAQLLGVKASAQSVESELKSYQDSQDDQTDSSTSEDLD